MSYSSIADFDQDKVIINTYVKVGKSYKSKGWALSREDIHDWIPTEFFEKECKVKIDNILANAIIRFNPRLFFRSDDLSFYLKELYDKGCSNEKVAMKIKIDKNELFKNQNLDEAIVNSIETKLLVGKSYSSGGWQLSKDVVAQLFPVDNYSGTYSICINNIISEAKLNTQFRLFYNSDDLSDYLEKLFYENPRQKVDAKIIFDYESSPSKEEMPDYGSDLSDEKVENQNATIICDICGNEFSGNELSSNWCNDCFEKICALDDYNKIKNSSLSNFIKKEFIKDKFGTDFNNIWALLIKYDFLTPFGELYKLNGNDIIEQRYSKYLTNDVKSYSYSNKRNRDKINDLINQQDEIEESKCVICGNVLGVSEVETCDLCKDKSLACEYLLDIVSKLPYGKTFTKQKLVDAKINSLNVELILKKLIDYDLILYDGVIFYNFNDVSFLNEFIKKYYNSSYELQVNYESRNSNIPTFSKKDLASEERIDSLIKWNNFNDFVSFKKGQYDFISVQFKQDSFFMYSKRFSTSYEAKIEAIRYLKSFGKVKLIDNSEIKLELKEEDKDVKRN